MSYRGASETMFLRQNRISQGDLNDDEDDDLVARIIERSAGTGVFHLIVPVINDDGTPEPQRRYRSVIASSSKRSQSTTG